MSWSLRRRLLYGALLWSVGLLLAVGLMAAAFLMNHPVQHAIVYHGARSHAVVLVIPVVVLLIAGLVVVRRALSPVARLRSRLADVRSGASPRIAGSYPAEVQPLVEDLNALLDHQEQAVRRAVAKAGDLAHGLKTPLAVLTHDVERVRAAGEPDLADRLTEQIDRMRRQVDYHLAHARAAASGTKAGALSNVKTSVDGLVRTLDRMYASRRINFSVEVDPGHGVRVQREDLDEMLGNLLDNACKWTRSSVAASTTADHGTIGITIEDDGPGVPPDLRAAVLQRGVRADEAAPGSGFGLAIVRELAEVYGGTITLDTAASGGLRAHLRLPR